MRIERFAFEKLWDFSESAPPEAAVHTAGNITPAAHDIESPMQGMIIESEAVAEPAEPQGPKLEFSQEDVELAKQQAKLQGFNEGKHAGQEETEQKLAIAEKASAEQLQRINEQLEHLRLLHAESLQASTQNVAELVLAAAKHVAGVALEAMPHAPIEHMLSECLPLFVEEPVIEIYVHEGELHQIEPAIQSTIQNIGFSGEVRVQADPALAPSNVRIDWGKASVERDMNQLWQQVEAALRSMPLPLNAPKPTQSVTGDENE